MAEPQAEPSARALGESLAALAVQVAALRGQVAQTNKRLARAGLHGDLDLVARIEELAQIVADALDAAAPRGPAAPFWLGLNRQAFDAQLAELRRWVDTVLRQHYGAMNCGTAGRTTSTRSGSCLPWPPSGTTPMATSGPTWAAPWSSTTAGFPAPCAAPTA